MPGHWLPSHQWNQTLNPFVYLKLAKRAAEKSPLHPHEITLLDDVERGLIETGDILLELISPESWSEALRKAGRRPRIMLNANVNHLGNFQIGISLHNHSPEVNLIDDYTLALRQGLATGWSSGYSRPRIEVAYFKGVGRLLTELGDHHTDVHRYCVLAALAEYERIRRILAADLIVVGAGRFDQRWDNERLAAVNFVSLERVLMDDQLLSAN